jgi:hypothetical protein
MLCSSYLPLGVPNELYLQAINEFSGAVAEEKEDFYKGSLVVVVKQHMPWDGLNGG